MSGKAADPGSLQLDARILVLLDAGSLPGGLFLLHLFQQQPVIWSVILRVHQGFVRQDFQPRAYKMRGRVHVRVTQFSPQQVRLRANCLRVRNIFTGTWFAQLQVWFRGDLWRVNDSVLGVLLSEDWVRFRGDELRVNLGALVSYVASR